MSRKTYTITLASDGALRALLMYLDGWKVDKKSYTVDETALTITTKNPNVVDVCTEEIKEKYYAITTNDNQAQPAPQQAAP